MIQSNDSEDDVGYWFNFVGQFFNPRGVFQLSLFVTDHPSSEEEPSDNKQFEIHAPALPRFFHAHFQSGVKSMQLHLGNGTVDRALAGGAHFVENQKASFTFWYETSHVVWNGRLRAQFDNEQKLVLLEFNTTNHEEFVSRRMVIEAAKPNHNWVKEWQKLNQADAKQSPEMSKKSKAKQMKSPPAPPPDIQLPDSAVISMGITRDVYRYLELAEVIGIMQPLMNFSVMNSNLGPYQALEMYNANHASNGAGPHAMMNGQQGGSVPVGPRTPSFGQFPMGASPATTHHALPGSPHIGSPAPGHMQAPGMALQQSQQGTSSSGPSANTSPASNKRRRPSAVKTEEDGSATPASMGAPPPLNGVMGGVKGKPPTPRMQNNKRLKTGNA